MQKRKDGTEEATAPSLTEFVAACLTEFEFLTKAHGFRVGKTKEEFPNPYAIHFERDGWQIIVEGLSYGFARLAYECEHPMGARLGSASWLRWMSCSVYGMNFHAGSSGT